MQHNNLNEPLLNKTSTASSENNASSNLTYVPPTSSEESKTLPSVTREFNFLNDLENANKESESKIYFYQKIPNYIHQEFTILSIAVDKYQGLVETSTETKSSPTGFEINDNNKTLPNTDFIKDSFNRASTNFSKSLSKTNFPEVTSTSTNLGPAPADPQPTSNVNKLKDALKDKFFLFKISTAAFLTMLAHDVIMFEAYPEQRYGTTRSDIWLGLPLSRPHEFGISESNLNTWINTFGTDKVTDTGLYWAPIITLLALPVLEASVKYILKVDSSEIYITNNYAKNISKALGYSLLTFAYLRYLSALSQKIEETRLYNKNKQTCEAQNKIFNYNEQIANFVCSICGDWDDLKLKFDAINDSQKCFDSLLKSTLSQTAIERLDRFKNFPTFTNIDLTQFNLNEQDDSLIESFFNKLNQIHAKISLFDVSLKRPANTPLTFNKVSNIIKYLKANSVDTFKMFNQFVINENLIYLINGFNDTNIRNLMIANSNLQNEASYYLGLVLPYIHNLKSLYLASNKMSDLDLPNLFINFPPDIESINLDNNALTSASQNVIEQQPYLRNISIAGMQQGQVNILSKLVAGRISVNVKNNKLKPLQFIDLAPSFNNPNITMLDVSENDLSSDQAIKVFFENASKKMQALKVGNVKASPNAGKYLRSYLNGSELVTFDFSHNFLNFDSFEEFLIGVFNSNVKYLDLSNTPLPSTHISLLTEYFKKYPGKLKFIVLQNNDITDDSGINLIRAMATAQIEGFDLSKNLLGDEFCNALKTVFPHSLFKNIDISYNDFGADALVNLITTKKTLSENFIAKGVPVSEENVIEILQTFINSPYALNYLSHKNLNQDERRALRNANLDSHLKYLSIDSCEDSSDILDRVSVVENFPIFNIECPTNHNSRHLLETDAHDLPVKEFQSLGSMELLIELPAILLFLFLLAKWFARRWQQDTPATASQGYRNQHLFSATPEIDLEANRTPTLKLKK